jgi:Cd2+/Zn2+-exporting ATPase
MDEIKPDSAAAIKELNEMNIEPIMLTGDSELSAKFVAHIVTSKKYSED